MFPENLHTPTNTNSDSFSVNCYFEKPFWPRSTTGSWQSVEVPQKKGVRVCGTGATSRHNVVAHSSCYHSHYQHFLPTFLAVRRTSWASQGTFPSLWNLLEVARGRLSSVIHKHWKRWQVCLAASSVMPMSSVSRHNSRLVKQNCGTAIQTPQSCIMSFYSFHHRFILRLSNFWWRQV